MKFSFLLSLIILLNSGLYAQVFEWVSTAGLDPGGNDHMRDIEMDYNQDIVVCGRVKNATDFGVQNTTAYGLKDIFVAKYDIQGNLKWVLRSGGQGDDYANGIFIDSSNHIYVAGTMKDSCFFASSDGNGVYKYFDGKGGFFLEYDPQGNLLWVEVLPRAQMFSIYKDQEGGIYAVGEFTATSIYQGDTLVSQDEWDGVVLKLDSNLQLQWHQEFAGNLTQRVAEIESDENGNLYILGMTRGDAMMDTILIDAPNNNYDCFLGKMNKDGVYDWLIPYGGNNQDVPTDMEYDFKNHTIVFSANRSTNGVVVRMDTSSNILNSYTLDGINGTAETGGVHVGINGKVYVSGRFTQDMRFNGDTILASKDFECYLVELTDTLTESFYKSFSSNQLNNKFPIFRDVVQDSLGDIYMCGEFLQTVDFDNLSATSSGSSTDLVVGKIEMPVKGSFSTDFSVYCSVQEVCFDIVREEGNIHYYELSIGNDSYQVTGDTCISNIPFGSYDVQLVSFNNFHSDTLFIANAITISNQYQPSIDSIYYDYPSLIFNGDYDSLIVYHNDSAISYLGGLDTTYFTPFFGEYYVIAYNNSGCFVHSDTIFTVDGIAEYGQFEIEIFPNPSSGIFYFLGKSDYEFTNVNLYSISGSLLFTQDFNGVLNLNDYPRGVYLFEAIYEGGDSVIKRIVKVE